MNGAQDLDLGHDRFVFRIGDAFPPGHEVGHFVLSFAAGLNDLLFVSKLLVPEEEAPLLTRELRGGETLYLLRSSASHVWELLALLRAGDQHEEVRSFLDSLVPEAQEHLDCLRRINDPDDEDEDGIRVKKTLQRTRNKTWHYPHPRDGLVKKTLKRLADYRGVYSAGQKMPSLRAHFADDAMSVFMTEWTRTEELFGQLMNELADLTVSLVHLGQYVIDQWVGREGVDRRHYLPGAPMRETELPAFAWSEDAKD